MSKQVVVADEPDVQRDVEDENEDWPGEDISEAKEETEASEKKGKNGKKRRKIIFIGAAALLVVAIAGLRIGSTPGSTSPPTTPSSTATSPRSARRCRRT